MLPTPTLLFSISNCRRMSICYFKLLFLLLFVLAILLCFPVFHYTFNNFWTCRTIATQSRRQKLVLTGRLKISKVYKAWKGTGWSRDWIIILWLLPAQLILWGRLRRNQSELREQSYDVSCNEQKGEIGVILGGRFGLQDSHRIANSTTSASHRMISLHCQHSVVPALKKAAVHSAYCHYKFPNGGAVGAQPSQNYCKSTGEPQFMTQVETGRNRSLDCTDL